MYLSNHSPMNKMWHEVIFKQSTAGTNAEFSFSSTCCLTKAKEPSLPDYPYLAEDRWIRAFPVGISVK